MVYFDCVEWSILSICFEEILKKVGGKTLSIDLWGKKKLAYVIEKQKYGTYVKLQFSGKGKCINSFGTELGHNPYILSYLTLLIEKRTAETRRRAAG